MNRIILLMSFVFSFATSNAENPLACVVIERNDASFIAAALSMEDVQDSASISNIDWKRVSSTEGNVKVQMDGQTVSINVVQDCESGKLLATVAKPDYSHFRCVEWVDCMPIIGGDPKKNFCTDTYFQWARDNCKTQPEKVY